MHLDGGRLASDLNVVDEVDERGYLATTLTAFGFCVRVALVITISSGT